MMLGVPTFGHIWIGGSLGVTSEVGLSLVGCRGFMFYLMGGSGTWSLRHQSEIKKALLFPNYV